MVGPDQPEELRCSCHTKFAEVTDEAITSACHGCGGPLPMPFAVLRRGKKAIKEHFTSLPPRRKRFRSKQKKRPRK